MSIDNLLSELRNIYQPTGAPSSRFGPLNNLAQQASQQTAQTARGGLSDIAGTSLNDAAYKQLADLSAGGGGMVPPMPPSQLALGSGSGDFLPVPYGQGAMAAPEAAGGLFAGGIRGLAGRGAIGAAEQVGAGFLGQQGRNAANQFTGNSLGQRATNNFGNLASDLVESSAVPTALAGTAGFLASAPFGGYKAFQHATGGDIKMETDKNTDAVDKAFIDNKLWDVDPIAAKEIYSNFKQQYSAKGAKKSDIAKQTLQQINQAASGQYQYSDATREQLAQQQAMQMLQPYLDRNTNIANFSANQVKQLNANGPYANLANQLADSQLYNANIENTRAANSLMTALETRQAKVRYAKNSGSGAATNPAALAQQQALNFLSGQQQTTGQ